MRRKLAFIAAILITLAAGFSRSDPDIWWHLASGRWIVTNGAIPFVDPFTSHPVPWVDYTWLFDVAVYGLYRLGGYGALLSGCVGLFIAIVLALHALLRELKSSSWFGDALVLVTLAGLTVLMTPRPWGFSILLSALELIILLRHRDTGSVRPLYLLPPLLALWANLHIQFVLGLLWLGIAVLAAVIESPRGRRFSEKPRALLICLTAAAVATLLNPYGYRIYEPVWFFLTAFGDFAGIQDSMPTWLLGQRFTWVVPLLLILVAADRARAGHARPRLRAFSTLFFIIGLLLGLRMVRDVWILLLSAIVFACDGRREVEAEVTRAPGVGFRVAIAAATLGLNLLFGMLVYGRPLDAALALRFPVWAADYVSRNVPPGPLFNDFSWGGYLTWALPEHPVLLDGRAPVCGPRLFTATASTWNGGAWRDNAELLGARVVIANRAAPLTSLLRGDERFKVTYEDAVAVVFEPIATFH